LSIETFEEARGECRSNKKEPCGVANVIRKLEYLMHALMSDWYGSVFTDFGDFIVGDDAIIYRMGGDQLVHKFGSLSRVGNNLFMTTNRVLADRTVHSVRGPKAVYAHSKR
jgi:hypothetical protein